MGEARTTMDRVTKSVIAGDWATLAACYATDAVATTPDQGEIKGAENIVGYFRMVRNALPDLRWEPAYQFESGDTAYDEGWVVGTHTEPLVLPDGEVIPATGKALRSRECDVVTVEGGRITSHRFYFDQLDLFTQLGLMPQD